MQITDARIIVTRPGRNFVTLRIETDEVFPHAYHFEEWLPPPGGRAGARGRHRRKARRQVPGRTDLRPGQPPGRRHDVELVKGELRGTGPERLTRPE